MSVPSGTKDALLRAAGPHVSPMPPVSPDEYASPAVRRAISRERAERRAGYRGRWWFPLLVLLIALSGCWGLLRADQLLADKLIWPSRGAQFVEVGPVPDNPSATGGRMTIVVGGLNRKSGTGPAAALMPALTVGHTRVFSLIYGSGINDQDILDKFDALMTRYGPREVSFFGSSMGGDVVLNLAAHAQRRRDGYRQDLQSGTVRLDLAAASGVAPDSEPGASRDRVPGAQAGRIAGLLITPDTRASVAVGSAGVAVLTGRPAPAAPNGTSASPADGRPLVPPRLGTIFLDCSPLRVQDVRDVSRTQADLLTGVTESLHTDGGAAARLAAELLAQQGQWSTGRFPFLDVRPDDLLYKLNQVWQEKIGAPGISTQLIKDQYGVIRRLDIDDVVDALGPGTRIVYFLPENRADDHTVRVDQVESNLSGLAAVSGLDLRFVAIPGGHHASAENNSDAYRAAITAINGGGT